MNDPDIMLNYLETLLKESNFTRAAEHLYISQPYLTQLIKRVEKKTGDHHHQPGQGSLYPD